VTVCVAGLWELGHNVPLSEAVLWRMVVRDFEVDEWYMHPVTGIADRRVVEWASAEEMFDHLRQRYQLVFVTEDSNTLELQHYEHPENACYVFGKCNWSPFLGLAVVGEDDALHLATGANLGLLWPHQCAAVVLWHRRLQWQ
jgi:hypothetical protein